jgi:hypothetical protein
VSPRKSSTSSGRPPTRRPRYLGLEAAGEHLPPLSARWWEGTLRAALDAAGVPDRFRVVRSEGRRAIVEVDHLALLRVRSVLDRPPAGPGASRVGARQTWGTLRGAKAWLRTGGASA